MVYDFKLLYFHSRKREGPGGGVAGVKEAFEMSVYSY
jgi:hypothetical protein